MSYYRNTNSLFIVLFRIIIATIYVLGYDYLVQNYIFKVFYYYANYLYHPAIDVGYRFLYLLISVIPIVMYSGTKYLSSVFSFFIYLFVYIPFINTLFFGGYSANLAQPYILVFFVSMCLFFITDGLFLFKRFMLRTNKPFSFKSLERIVVVVFIVVVLYNLRKISFVNILSESDVLYEKRAANGLSGTVSGYIISWLKNALIPLLMVSYLSGKKYFRFIVSVLAMIVVFMIDMSKITFMMSFIILLLYAFYQMFKKLYLKYFGEIVMLMLLFFAFVLYYKYTDNSIAYSLAAVFIMRSLCVEGMELATYLNFFELQGHPFTHYTHIGIIGKITGSYPYSESIGLAVTSGNGNANGCFWLMDGIAADGLIGCVIASLLFILFKAIMNGIGLKYSKELCVIVLMFSIASMINVSLFTALLSCGFILLYLVFALFELDTLHDL